MTLSLGPSLSTIRVVASLTQHLAERLKRDLKMLWHVALAFGRLRLASRIFYSDRQYDQYWCDRRYWFSATTSPRESDDDDNLSLCLFGNEYFPEFNITYPAKPIKKMC